MKKLLIHIVFVLCSLTGYAQTSVPIPDTVFLKFLKENTQAINTSGDLVISIAAQVTGTLTGSNLGITNLEGIQYFSKITKINFSNNAIVSIPSLVPMAKLETVHLYGNKLTSVPDFVGILNLKTVLLYENELTQMPMFGNNPILEEIIISKNKLTSLSPLSVVTSLLKLDVGQNQLTALPDLSSNVNLEELICWSNKITTLPSLSNLIKLTRINVGMNKLTVMPDLSNNALLTIVAFDNNLLTDIPNILNYNLTDVRFYNNFFTFEDLLPYTLLPNFSTDFDCTPMLPIPIVDTLDTYYGQVIEVHTNIDVTLSNVSYEWFEGTTSIASGTQDLATITSLIGTGITKRYVYAKIKHASISDLTLVTDSILVRYNPCPVSTDISYTATKKDCGNSGNVQIEVQGYIAPTTSYVLTSSSFGTVEYYNSNKINGLIDTAYSLQVNFSPACSINYATPIKMPAVDCNEVFMTPNNDGDMDTYLFTGTGNVIIYDKYGKEVKRANLPYDWDGTGQRERVQPGYYIAVVNGGKSRIYISVLY